MDVSVIKDPKRLWPLLFLGVCAFAHAAGRVCVTDNLQPDQCGPISTRVVLAGGTLAFFDIPANPTLGTLPVNAAYFSPDGFNLEGNGGSTVAAYSGSLKIKAVVPVNGGVDTLFENGAVYFSPNGQNLGGACANGVCTIAAYGGPAPVTSIVPVSGGVDVVFAMSGGVENAYFSPDGVHLSAGGATVPIYQGGVAIDQIVPVGGSVVAIFENGAAYYSPDNRNLGGGGNTVSAYIGSVPIARIVKVGSGVLTQFQNDAVYLSPGGQNLGGGGSTIAIANWVHAADAPFPVRDSGKGAVFQGKLYLSGGFVRRGKARSLSGSQTHPATIAPAGSHWSGRGGNKTTEAFKVRVTLGDSANTRAATSSER
jgi:hypothetical protein